MLLRGSTKQISISYDSATKIIDNTTRSSYTPLGDELQDTLASSITALASAQQIRLDGKVVNVVAYNIDGYNYLRLRDIATLLDFAVNYDEETRMVTLDLANAYSE